MHNRNFPPWVVLHVPHDSTDIPDELRSQFLLSDSELQTELIRMTDHHTHRIFADSPGEASVVRAPFSRLVVDVERFPDDADEPMSSRGMGAVYTMTSQLAPLRHALTIDERESMIRLYYEPHHELLEATVARLLDLHGQCLVIDCHSFPDVAHPYEMADPSELRPDICIGTDNFHTDAELANAFRISFEKAGWQVSLNKPFAGALVPASRYRHDHRVKAIMIEVNRSLYLHESNAVQTENFESIAERIRECCLESLRIDFGNFV